MTEPSRSRSVVRLLEALTKLPGIGPETADRLAYHLLRADPRVAHELAQAIVAARDDTRVCHECFNLDETDPCRVCVDPARDRTRLLVVEDPREVGSFDASGWRGLYHVLQGRISALEGVRLEDLTVAPLLERVGAGAIEEVCLATNPDLEGEGTARILAERLADAGVRVTRLARGIPAGATITQVSTSILADAIEGRRELS